MTPPTPSRAQQQAPRCAQDAGRPRLSLRPLVAGRLPGLACLLGGGVLGPASVPSRRPAAAVGSARPASAEYREHPGRRSGGRREPRPREAGADGGGRGQPGDVAKLTLRAEGQFPDGTPNVVEAETLQPPEWIAQQGGAQIGSAVALPLDLTEMGLPRDLPARVLANEHCPAIADGPGCVVLTTVSSTSRNLFRLTLRDDRGHETFVPSDRVPQVLQCRPARLDRRAGPAPGRAPAPAAAAGLRSQPPSASPAPTAFITLRLPASTSSTCRHWGCCRIILCRAAPPPSSPLTPRRGSEILQCKEAAENIRNARLRAPDSTARLSRFAAAGI